MYLYPTDFSVMYLAVETFQNFKTYKTIQLLRISYCAFILFTTRICLSPTGQQPTIISLSQAVLHTICFFLLIICYTQNKLVLCCGAWSDWGPIVSNMTVCFLISAVLTKGHMKPYLKTMIQMKSLFHWGFF